MAGSPSIQYAQNGDVSIAYAVDGEGPIDLLFVPGFVGNLDVALSHPARTPFWDRLRSLARGDLLRQARPGPLRPRSPLFSVTGPGSGG